MSTSPYTVFYDQSTKELNMVINGTAPVALVASQEELGFAHLLVNASNTPGSHHYVNDAEDDIVERSTFSITVDKEFAAVDETFTFSGVPEGTSILINKTISGTMNSDSSLTLTATEPGSWRVVFTKAKYYERVFLLGVSRIA
jgi:hypothetical protein